MRTPDEEIAQLRQEKDAVEADHLGLVERNALQVLRIQQLAGALREYGQHKPECAAQTRSDSWGFGGRACTCGFQKILGALQT